MVVVGFECRDGSRSRQRRAYRPEPAGRLFDALAPSLVHSARRNVVGAWHAAVPPCYACLLSCLRRSCAARRSSPPARALTPSPRQERAERLSHAFASAVCILH
eukprot:3872441-Rhodomonas_salina.2